MSLVRYRPWSLGELHSEIERLLGNGQGLTSRENPSFSMTENSFWPEVDIEDNDKNYVITASVPGVPADKIDVDYHDGTLTLRGETTSEHEEKDKNFIRTERSKGSFVRSFSMPDIDADNIDASCKDGVLKISLPKSSSKAKTKIKVKNGS